MNLFDNMNEGYDEDEENIVFHHKNGEYRKYMSEELRNIATGKSAPKRGFFRVLVNTRGNRITFFVLCLSIALYFTVNLLGKNSNEDKIGEMELNLTAFSFNEEVYVTLDAKPYEDKKKKSVKINPVKVKVLFELVNIDDAVCDSREAEFIFRGEQIYAREVFKDYEVKTVKCRVEASDKTVELKDKVAKR